jgi:molybdopterin-guanine dinucleotide biosynthesis protein A
MPLLDADVFRALIREGGSVYALAPRGPEALVAVLDRALLAPLLRALEAEKIPRTDAALVAAGAHGVAFADAAPFANVNTPDDLARLE